MLDPEITKCWDDKLRANRKKAIMNLRKNNLKFWFSKEKEDLATIIRGIKEKSTRELKNLVPIAIKNLKKNGFKVHYAGDIDEVKNILLGLVKGSRLVCKSKSVVMRELRVSETLQKHGIRVVETDIGDRLLQLEGGTPSHQHHPSAHLTLRDIRSLLETENEQLPEHADVLAGKISDTVRKHILNCDWGIVGCNAISADEGSLFTVENEGNIRWLTTIPKKLMVVTSIDKIVKSYYEAMMVCYATGYFAMSKLTTYIDVITGPSKSGDIQMKFSYGVYGPREIHVILVDNGRMNCIEKGFGELLYCINCSACLDICPVYEEVGESFGVKHALARGLMLTAWLEGLEAIGDKLGMCLTCNLCFSICPSKINTGKLLPEFRRRIVNGSA